MKKILLTLFVGFCFGAVAVAQEPAKAAKKKAAASPATSESKPATAEMIKAKEADFKANHSGKPAQAPTTAAAPKASKAAELTSDKSN